MIQQLSSYIAIKVQGVTGVDSRWVFEYENPTWLGFPAISVTLKSWSGKFITTGQHNRTYIFTVRIYQEIAKNNVGASQAENLLRTLGDNIVTAFDNDNMLGNTDTYTLPIGGQMGWVQNQPIRTMEIDLECHAVVSAVG